MWRDGGYVERLAGFQVILFDHRGRGRSARPGGVAAHRLEHYVADVRALADTLGWERYGFVGYSFGGLVGLAVAAGDPRVEGLAALGCVFDAPGQQPDPAVDGGYAEAADMRELVAVIERSEAIELPGWLREDFLATDGEQFQLTMEALAGVPDPWHLLAEIASPSVLIAGDAEDPDGTLPQMAA